MSAESKQTEETNLQPTAAAVAEALSDAEAESGDEETSATVGDASTSAAPAKKKKKKKSKTKKLKDALTGGSSKNEGATASSSSGKEISKSQSAGLEKLLDLNPGLKSELAGKNPEQLAAMLSKMNIQDLLTGTAIGKGGKKDLASHKFWSTQPVPKIEEQVMIKEDDDGPLEVPDMEEVMAAPAAKLPTGFEWCLVDLNNEKEIEELYNLLADNYVEDGDAMFRFNYSRSFLDWVLKTPGWRPEWHIGVRATVSRRLLAFISAIPVDLTVRNKDVKMSEVNFLCVHKKLRDKRLAPVLIAEVTRACYRVGIFQAIYTAGVLLPGMVSTCRYFHRSLDWERLHDMGFSHLPPGSTRSRQVMKYKLPTQTTIPGTRVMTKENVPVVRELLQRYLNRFAMRQQWSEEELDHWMVHDPARTPEQVVWSYVVEDPSTKKITDFWSFYRLESTALAKKDVVKAAYMFYYATEVAFENDEKKLKVRLNELVKDMLIVAKKAKFDVLNALTLLDNPMFLEQQLFGQGDGLLHYYLYNWKTALIPGGINSRSSADEKSMGGIGVVML